MGPRCWQVALCALSVVFRISHAIQITGARGGQNDTTGARPFRQDLEAFVTTGPSFDLYIMALNEMQTTNQSDPLSYFQIAGMAPNIDEKPSR
jgi:hypothetical protein